MFFCWSKIVGKFCVWSLKNGSFCSGHNMLTWMPLWKSFEQFTSYIEHIPKITLQEIHIVHWYQPTFYDVTMSIFLSSCRDTAFQMTNFPRNYGLVTLFPRSICALVISVLLLLLLLRFCCWLCCCKTRWKSPERKRAEGSDWEYWSNPEAFS